MTGVDRAGRPSCTWRPALAPAPAAGAGAAAAAAERRVRGLVRAVERAQAVNRGAEGVTMLCDCAGLSCAHYDHRAALAALAVFRVRAAHRAAPLRPAPRRPAPRRPAPAIASTRSNSESRAGDAGPAQHPAAAGPTPPARSHAVARARGV